MVLVGLVGLVVPQGWAPHAGWHPGFGTQARVELSGKRSHEGQADLFIKAAMAMRGRKRGSWRVQLCG